MFNFTKDCFTGIVNIDNKRLEYFETLNYALREDSSESCVSKIKNILGKLNSYSVDGFKEEEEYMTEIVDKELEIQIKEHRWFIEKLDEFKNLKAGNLAYGQQRKLEIARALATRPKLLLLDEPAAGMNPQETAELMDTIKLIREKYKITILLIEHDMKLVSGICEYLTVLNFGTELVSGTPGEVLNDHRVITAYLGE